MSNPSEISIHPAQPDFKSAWKYRSNWQSSHIYAVENLVQHVTTKSWSPIIWKEGQRKTPNFLYSDWGALDCDGTYPIEQACKDWCDTTSLIVTTKSDRPESRRYRVIFPWEKRIEDVNQYIFNTDKLVSCYDMDPSGTDGGRWFWPGMNVVQLVPEGMSQPVLKVPAGHSSIAEKEKKAAKKYANLGASNIFPQNIKMWLAGNYVDGERNTHCYRVGKYLTFWGMCEAEVLDLILRSKLPLDNKYSMGEAEHAAKNGIRKAKKIIDSRR